MTLRLLLAAFAASIVTVVLFWNISDLPKFTNYFAENLRGNLFAGFLTVGGFLFSLKTFIVIKMKENVYDHRKYKDRVEEHRKHNKDITFYGPLRRLSGLLFVSVLSSIFSAVMQLTVGLIDKWYAALACIWSSVIAITLLTVSIFVIKNNLDQWFEFLEDSQTKT